MTMIKIPTYWSSDDALTIYEFISDLEQAIWNTYGDQIKTELESQSMHDTLGDSAELESDRIVPF